MHKENTQKYIRCVDCPPVFSQNLSVVRADCTQDVDGRCAGMVKLSTIELQTNDGKHEDGEE